MKYMCVCVLLSLHAAAHHTYYVPVCVSVYVCVCMHVCMCTCMCVCLAHTLSIAFQHLPPNSAIIGYTTEAVLFISMQLSTNVVSTL